VAKESLSEEAMRMKRNKIILVAAELFLENGIDSVKMTDIADASGIGVASLYRYFGTRTNIVIEAGTLLWKDVQLQFSDFLSEDSAREKNGLDRISGQFDFIMKLYRERPDFICFLDAFDRLMLAEKVPAKDLTVYEKSIVDLEELFLDACRKGIEDGSIRKGLPYRELYQTAAHAMNALAEKTARGPILESDRVSEIDSEPSFLRDMILYYLRSD
jgi:AcrR family transcriptional regulator